MRWLTRATCVSTMIPEGRLKAVLSTTFAVFRATPGSVTSSSTVRGTSPANFESSSRLMFCTDFAFCL